MDSTLISKYIYESLDKCYYGCKLIKKHEKLEWNCKFFTNVYDSTFYSKHQSIISSNIETNCMSILLPEILQKFNLKQELKINTRLE